MEVPSSPGTEFRDGPPLPMQADLLRTQLAHDAWAIRTLLERCATLAVEAWRRPLGLGHGSLERNLAHLVECTWYFRDAFAGVPYEPRAAFGEGPFTPRELIDQAEAAHANLAAAALGFEEARGLAALLEFPVGSGRRVGAHLLLAQAFDHGTHHRTQCLHLLDLLGERQGLELHPLRFGGVDPA